MAAPLLFRVLIVGPPNSGKSALVRRLCDQTFREAKYEAGEITTPFQPNERVLYVQLPNGTPPVGVQLVDCTMDLLLQRPVGYELLLDCDAIIYLVADSALTQLERMEELMQHCEKEIQNRHVHRTLFLNTRMHQMSDHYDFEARKLANKHAGIAFFSVDIRGDTGLQEAWLDLVQLLYYDRRIQLSRSPSAIPLASSVTTLLPVEEDEEGSKPFEINCCFGC
jgi:GTPase SAR1 family protein